MRLSSDLKDAIVSRLAREPEWAQSALGKAFALTVDLEVVSLKVMADYLLVLERTMYRVIRSKTGQPSYRPHQREEFHADCERYVQALQAAYDADAFKALDQWAGHQDHSPREEALRILIEHTPQ